MMAEAQKEKRKTEQSDEKLNCSVELVDSGPWQKKISIVIPRDQIDAELDSQYGDLSRTAEVPGFRKGHAPRGLVHKRFGKEVLDQTKLRLLSRAFEQVDEEQNFEILGEPDFDPLSIEMPESGDMTFEYEVEVKPEFELPKLEGVRIEKPIFEVTKDKVDDALAEICKRYGQLEDISDQAAQEDDVVRADVTIKIDGLDEEEKLEDHPLRVAEGGVKGLWMEDLAKTLKGVKVGQSRSCKTKAPETHSNEAWQNKDADITIAVTAIRRHKAAELNAEFFEKLGIDGEDQLREFVSDDLERRSDKEVRQQMAQQVTDYLNSKVDFELPTKVAARHGERALQRRYHELMNMGIPQDQIAENLEKLRASSSEQAAKELKTSFIMEAVADKLELTVSEGEINGWIAQMAAQYKRRPEKLRDQMRAEGQLTALESQILQEKAVDKILEMAQVVDAPVTTDKPKDAAETQKKK
jgi:trigger factor